MRCLAATLAIAPLLAVAQTTTDADAIGTVTDDGPYYTNSVTDDLPVSFVLSQYYGSEIPAKATGAAATSLVSALYDHMEDLRTDKGYMSAANDLYYAVATQTNADEIIASIDSEGYLNDDYTTASWFVSGVPKSAQSEWESVISGFKAIETSVLGADSGITTTATGSVVSATATETSGGSSAGVPSTSASGSGQSSATGASASSSSSGAAGAQGPKATGGAVAGLAAVVALGAAVLY